MVILGGKKHYTAGAREQLVGCVWYSDYYDQLEDSARLNSIGVGVDDPYTFSSEHTDAVPNTEYPCRHLINIPSPLKKSLKQFGWLLAGWVGNLSIDPWPHGRG